MENSDVDVVISIPDTPESVVRRNSVRREVKRRPHSPEATVGYQREEYRNYLNGRSRSGKVSEVEENRGKSSENGHHRSRSSSGSNALFRRAEVEKDKGKSISVDSCVAREERNPVLNLNKRNGHAHDTASRCLRSEDIREIRSKNDCSPIRGDHKGKGKVECGSVSNRGTIDLSSERKPNRGTKRLVRYGCISPEGIAARAKQAADTSFEDTVNVEPEVAAETTSSVNIRDIVSGNDIHRRARGKRPEIPRSSVSRVASRDAVDSEVEGWVNTRNRKLSSGHEKNHRDESDTKGICSSVSRLDVHESDEVECDARPHRRRRNGISTSRAANEPEVFVISSSGEPSSSRTSRTHNNQRHGTQVLEIEDSSPEVRVSRAPRGVENDESDLKVRQIEADEILARELQEQLYQETTLMRNEQVDENIARFLEQEENPLRASSSRTTRSSNTIAGGRSRLEARLQPPSSRRRFNPPQPRAAVRAPPRGRGHRLGRAPASLHQALNGGFPDAMGLEMRMDFLEELENVIGHSIRNSNLLHVDRDFTEDDYELLLALDDNNHRHAGASTHRINNLPESIVQTDNQETCVICLETPTIGDTIRHLPCFHKFHKDCIDPWLGRSKQCPVCKSSVT